MFIAEKPDALTWLAALSNHLDRLNEYRKRIEPRLASEFSVLRYLRTDEMGLSQILADLLNPSGPHGQGNRFLRCFLDRYWPKVTELEDSKIKVRTEVSTDRIPRRQRRMDIEVDLGTSVIGIENKPWATDQQAQLADYVEHLRRSRRPFKLLYLAGQDARMPSEGSISSTELRDRVSENNLEMTSYAQLREWLRDCARCCDNERVTMFLRDLDRFISQQFAHEGVDFESRLVVEEATASRLGVHAVVQLAAIGFETRLYLLAKLEDQLQVAIPKALSDAAIAGWTLQIAKALNEKGAAVELSRSPDSALMLSLAFDNLNCRDCAFGVTRRNAADDVRIDKLRNLDSMFGIGQSSEWWGWWRSFDPRNWWYEPRIWMQIAEGTFVERISQLFVGMIQVLESTESLTLFESKSQGEPPPLRQRAIVPVSELTRRICGSPQLVGHLFAVEAADSPFRRAMAARAESQLRIKVNDAMQSRCQWSEPEDLTERYSGIGFKLRDKSMLKVRMEFQASGCRRAIYGLLVEDLDGGSKDAEIIRQRLAKAGLETGKHSAAWVWYRALDIPHWFDSPETAVLLHAGEIAEQTATRLIKLVEIVDSAGLFTEPSSG